MRNIMISDSNIEKLHEVYLPFSKTVIKEHFMQSPDKHLQYFTDSICRYRKFEENSFSENDKKKNDRVRQIEKDEKFWTLSTLLTLFYSENSKEEIEEMLKKAYGKKPPLSDINDWSECLDGELKLYFEPNLPSPERYLKYMENEIEKVNLIPYVLEKAKKNGKYRTNLEGPTNVDAIIINPSNGFSVIIEAKALSDISCQTTNNVVRNQIIRNIDIMLEKNDKLEFPLNKRNPDNSLFS